MKIGSFFILLILFYVFSQSCFADEKSTDSKTPYSAKMDYTYDSFSQDFSDWQMLSLGFSAPFKYGSIIPRINLAKRFDQQGQQFEVDVYPHFAEGRYAYLNVGYSDSSSIFPKYRIGAELYQSLGAGFEASAGFRKLWFDSTSPTIWTGSIAKYLGNYYVAIRPFFSNKDFGDSWSAFAEIRRYVGDQTYFVLKGGGGEYSDQRALTLEIFRLDSKWISVGTHWQFGSGTAINATISVERMQPRPNSERQQTTISIGIEQPF